MKTNRYKTCIHCGTPFSQAGRPDSEFCCNGCDYVYRLIKKEGLDRYYDLRDKRIAPVASSALHPRDYGWLETLSAKAEAASPKSAALVLDLQGISCVGCVWLIEKVFRDMPGAMRIDINSQYGQVRLQWRPGIFAIVDFAREIQQFGYVLGPPGERPREESQRLLGRLGLCGAFALNAMIFTLPRYLGMDPDFQLAGLFELLSLLFATLSLLAGGSYFINRGIRGILQGVLHIDFPIALGILVAWGGSLLGWLIGDTRFLYFDFVAIFIFLMLVGRWVQERALENNRHRLLSRNKSPREAHVVGDDLDSETTQPLDAIAPGQRLRILPGEVVPVLAELESHTASLSLEWINGESDMRTLRQGQWVPSGAQNIGLEPLLINTRQTWRESLLHRLLESNPGTRRNAFMERILRVYLIAVLVIAALGGVIWATLLAQPLTAIQVVLSVLIVSCPCALGVAYPLAQEWAVLNLRRHGIFVRTADIFRSLGGVRKIVFDKTGTLTLEAPELENPDSLDSLSPEDEAVLREMVKSSLHPVSRALREAFLSRPASTSTAPADLTIREEVGMGLIAEAPSLHASWSLGRPGWAKRSERSDESDRSDGSDSSDQSEFRKDGTRIAGFSFREALRSDAQQAIEKLRKSCHVTILSGDRLEKVQRLAKALNLPESAAVGDQTPEEKASFMEALDGKDTLYIGDGANDALAFEKATVRGTPATPHGLLQDKADFYFTGRSLGGLLELFRIHKMRAQAVRASFAFAVSYNLIVVAIALAGHMHPLLAAILMPLSSLATITIVALRYRKEAGKLKS